ncbi:MAG: hypothetical protein LBJ25_04175, partial [Candidatus Margulisbacteria bacterium]|nr:hypothetical protein [Candidatus Margulisiibacteriota bacterium]
MTIAAGQKMYADDILNLTFFPIGTILQFSGSQYSRLTSARTEDNKVIWTLCDGTSVNEIAVPNLVDKFLRGSLASGASGGANSQSVSLQTANLPAHNHEATGLSLSGLSASGLSIATSGGHTHTVAGTATTASGGGGHMHSVSGTSSSAGSHSHNFPVTGANNNDHSGSEGNGAADTDAGFHDDSSTRDAGAHTHTFSCSTPENGGTHSHDVHINMSTGENGGSHSHTI